MPFAAGLYYEETGSGKPLILLHGNGEDHTYFEHQVKEFSHYFRVITPDTRGHGQSERGTGLFNIRRFAEDLGHFMDELGLEKAHILGFSDGGNIALVFALFRPEAIDRLILNGANLDPSGVKRWYQFPVELGYRLALRAGAGSEKARARAELLGLMVNDPNIEPGELKKITCPALVIAGRRDMIKEEHTRRIAGMLPDSRLVILPGDHFVARKRPKAFNAAVLDFLRP